MPTPSESAAAQRAGVAQTQAEFQDGGPAGRAPSGDAAVRDANHEPPRRGRPLDLPVNLALLTLLVVLSGLTPVFAKIAMAQLPPLATGAARFALAALLISGTYALWRLRYGAAAPPIAADDWPRFLLAAALCVPANQAAFLTGVKLANASHSGLFYGLNPVAVYLLTLLLGRASWSRRMALAAGLASLGAATVAFDGLVFERTLSFLAGDGLLFIAVFTWAGYLVVSAPLGHKYGPVRSLMVTLLIGSAMYLPVVLIDGGAVPWSELTRPTLLGFFYLACVTSFVNYLLWLVATVRMDLNRVSVAVNLSPLVAVAAAHLLRGERLSHWLAAGGALIVAAITLANWDKLRARP